MRRLFQFLIPVSRSRKATAHFNHLTKYSSKLIGIMTLALLVSACEQNNTNNEGANIANAEATKRQDADHEVQEQDFSVESFAKNLKVKYEVVDNRPNEDCDPKRFGGNCFKAAISLTAPQAFANKNWRIYFSQLSPVILDYSDLFDVKQVQGDLHYIEPTEKLTEFTANQTYRIEYRAGFWQISEYDSPPNFYIVYADKPPQVIASTKAVIDPETGLEKLQHVKAFENIEAQYKRTAKDSSQFATASKLYQREKDLPQELLDVSAKLIPEPKETIVDPKNRKLSIDSGLRLLNNAFAIAQKNPAIVRMMRLGMPISESGALPIALQQSSNFSGESYALTIDDNGISISAATSAGAFYGLQSLAGLYAPDESSLPYLTIKDSPRYPFRGVHLDVARNFRSKTFVFRLLDQMAAYKLNKLHLHLGDDEGWRVEIPGLPELTQVGAVRCHDLSESECLLPQLGAGVEKSAENNGFYSVIDYQEILKEAAKRHIQVIPSFDMPGHSRAAVKSMQARYRRFAAKGQLELAEEYLLNDPEDRSVYSSVQFYSDNTINVCRESSYHFLEKVISEVVSMHRNANVPMETYHIGADETPGAWQDSPQCKKFVEEHQLSIDELSGYFIERVSHFLSKQGIKVAAWNDGLAEVDVNKMPKNVQANAWTPLFWDGHQAAHTMANQGWDVVVSVPDATYFDFPYEADPKERGYYWGARSTNTRQVFELMPDNLPLHAEIWTDRENNPYKADDTVQKDESGKIISSPLKSNKQFIGMQAHLWSEMVRSDATAEYLLFPRLLAIAERAWHKADWEPDYNYQGAVYSQDTQFFSKKNKQKRDLDWQQFANVIGQKEFHKLAIDHWRFRLPTIGAVIEAGYLKVVSPFPGMLIEYQIDGSDWKPWSFDGEPVAVKPSNTVKVRAASPEVNRKGRALNVDK